MIKGREGLRLALLLVLLAISGPLPAESLCDPDLEPEIDPSIKYQERSGDRRCEGFYQANVANTVGGLEVIGLLQRPLRWSGDGAALRVSAVVTDRAVRVRGQGVPVKLYYRLDAELAPGGVLSWPLELLQSEGIEEDEIGLFGLLADSDNWYVPLDVVGSHPSAIRPHVQLRASVDTTEVHWRYAPAAEGRCEKLSPWSRLDAPGGFAGGEVIPVDLPETESRQLCLEVAARTERDGEWLKRLVRIRR